MSSFSEPSIPLICIPVVNRGDLLRRCIESIDMKVERLVLINNGRNSEVADEIERLTRGRPALIGTIVVITPKRNLGVAPSWNLGIRMMMGEGCPYMLLIGSDVQMSEGDLLLFHENFDPQIALRRGNHDYSLFMLTPKAVKEVGYFDENIFPAYFEDNDYTYRLKLRGLDCPDVPGVKAIHGSDGLPGSLTVYSDPDLGRACDSTFLRNRDYYCRKWGGLVNEESFIHPFNDESKSLSDWEIDHNHVALNMWPDK